MAHDEGRVLSRIDPARGSKYSRDVLLAKNDSKTVSDTFSVVDVPVRLVAFNLSAADVEMQPVADVINVLRVWTPANDMRRDSCGNLLPGEEAFEAPLRYNHQQVQLTARQNELVIDAAGTYRLEYVGDNRPAIQVVFIPDSVVTVDPTTRGLQDTRLR